MKIYLILLVFIFNTFTSNKLHAENNISYLDLDRIFKTSLVGKSINDQIAKINEKDKKRINNSKKKLIEEEKSIISQKNVLDTNEYNKKISVFQKNIETFKNNNLKLVKKANNQKLKATSEILKILNPLLAKYSLDNSISLIIRKKNIIIGKSELDITDDIIKMLNSKIKKINIK